MEYGKERPFTVGGEECLSVGTCELHSRSAGLAAPAFPLLFLEQAAVMTSEQ